MPAREEKRSLFALIGSLPGQLIDLVTAELERLKQELLRKLKHAGIGVAFLLVAAIVLFFAVGVLVIAGVLGLGEVMPPWLAALCIAGALLILTALFAWLGVRHLGKGVPTPDETLASIRKDVDAVRGTEQENER